MGEVRPAPPKAWKWAMYAVYGVTAVCVVATVLESMALVDYFWPLMLKFWVLPLCCLAWLGLTVAGAAFYRSWAKLAVLPVLAFVVVGAAHVAWLIPRAQLLVSESSLAAVADRCEPAEQVWAGAFRIDQVQPADDACLLYLSDGLLDRYGLVRLPDGAPADTMQRWNITTEHFSGDWYRFTWHF